MVLGITLSPVCVLAQTPTTDPVSEDSSTAKVALARVDKLSQQVEKLREAYTQVPKIDQALFIELVFTVQTELRNELDRLIKILGEQETAGKEATQLRAQIEAAVTNQSRLIKAEISMFTEIIKGLKEQYGVDIASSEDNPMRLFLARSNTVLDDQLGALIDNVERQKALGMDTMEDDAYLEQALQLRAVVLAGRIRIALDNIKMLREWLKDAPPEQQKGIEKQLRLFELGKDTSAESLTTTLAAMKDKGMNTTEFGQVLVVATGNLLEETVDTEVALGLLRKIFSAAVNWLDDNVLLILYRLVTFFLILFAFKLLAGIIGRLVDRAVEKSRLQSSQLLQNFIHGVVSKVVIVIGVIIALSQLGIEIGPLLAGMGIMGFIVGFALQDSLSNFASGMMILVHRPFDIGDVVEAGGVSGTVKAMSLITTTILTFDNQTLVVPNNKIWGSTIRNVTSQDDRRVDLSFSVGHEVDVDRVEAIFNEIVAADERVLKEPAPLVKMHKLSDYAVEFIVRPWVHTADYWSVYWDMTRAVKQRLDVEGIPVPHPQRDVFIRRES